jgi:anti-anti-sigma regulatory factor
MPVKLIKKPGFAYVAYCRKSPKDFVDFKSELLNFAKAKENSDDIVVDITKSDSFNEGDIGVLAGVLQALHGTKQTLRLIMSPPIYKKMESINLLKAKNIVGYDNYKDLIVDLNKI